MRGLCKLGTHALLCVPGMPALARRLAQRWVRWQEVSKLNRGRIYNLLAARTAGTAPQAFTVPVPGLADFHLNLELQLTDELSRQWYFWGYDHYEPEVRRVMWALLQDMAATDVGEVLDIGANLGYFSLYLGAVLKQRGIGRVHAFEPSPAVFARLKHNLLLNPELPVTLHESAVADVAGEAELFLADHNTWGHSAASLVNKGVDEQIGSVKVAVQSVDEFVTAHGIKRVGMIKMDCEGAEAKALTGAVKTISRDQPHIILELIPRYDESYRILFAHPMYRAYRKFLITADGLIERAEATSSYHNRDWLFTVRPPASGDLPVVKL